MIKQPVAEELFGVCCFRPQTRHAIDDVVSQVEAVEVIQHDHIEGGGRCSLFLVPANVQMLMIVPAIRQAMNQPGIAVIGEDDRFVLGE